MFAGVTELRPGVDWDGLGLAPTDAPLLLDSNNFDRPLDWYAKHLKELLTTVIAA